MNYLMSNEVQVASSELVFLSKWIDRANVDAGRDAEAITWGRLAKIAEEDGEVIRAFIAATGQNPRKGLSGSLNDVKKELLDVAITALGAFEHLDNHQGQAISTLLHAISNVSQRAVTFETERKKGLIDEHHYLTHGFCIHGEIRGDCAHGGY